MSETVYPVTPGRYLIEASAGTGKTYTITHLVRALVLTGVPVRRILVTTFTKAAAAELKDRILELLNATLAGETDVRRKVLLMLAVSSIDEMTVGTIHSFCQKMLREFALESGGGFETELIPDDSAYAEKLARRFYRSQPAAEDGQAKDYATLREAADQFASQDVDRIVTDDDAVRGEYEYFREHFRAEKERDGVMSFDDLVRLFHDALKRPGGDDLAKKVRERYGAVFVDEFQDTDRLQYGIFDACFPVGCDTVFYMIGDPKQAIYGFRGADVNAYLEAKKTVPPERSFTLSANYRSSPAMIRAVNLIFSDGDTTPGHLTPGVFLQWPSGRDFETIPADDGIPFVSVKPGEANAARFPANDGVALRLRHYRMKKADADAQIYRDVVDEIRWLLSGSCKFEVAAKGSDQTAPVKASDIAILVQRRSEAAKFVSLLNDAGIAASACKAGKIYDTPEAQVMLLLLRAILHPETRWVRGLLLSPFFRMHWREFAADDAVTEPLRDLLAQCGADWAQAGLPAAFLRFLDTPVGDKSSPRANILAGTGGERAITNYLQLMELLYQKETADHLLPEDVLDYLNLAVNGRADGTDAVASADDLGDDNPDQLRLDRDSASVQVMTMFAAKGLEFPIVFIPFPGYSDWSNLLKKGRPVVKKERGVVTVDFTRKDAEIKRSAQEEEFRNRLRLLYVALTRATQLTYLYTQSKTPSDRSSNFVKSVQGAIMVDRADGHLLERWNTDYFASTRDILPTPTAKWCEPLLSDPDNRSERKWDVFATAPDRTGSDLAPRRDVEALERPLVARPLPRVPDTWHMMSFTSFERLYSDLENEDEREPETSADYRDTDAARIVPADEAPETANRFRAFPHGTRPGTLVHEMLEHFTAEFGLFAEARESERSRTIDPILTAALESAGYDSKELLDPLFDGMAYALRTPLPGFDDGFRLCDLGPGDGSAEMEFFLNAPDSLHLGRITEILESTASEAARRIVTPFTRKCDRNGVLNGLIDLVFEHGGRYYIVDWKTNWLGETDADYSPGRVARAMGENMYVLQSYLYAAALLKMFRARGLDYRTHFGGVYYLFLRGLGSGVNGIWHDVPPEPCLNALLGLFEKGTMP